MRATEIIRGVLDFIDLVDQDQHSDIGCDCGDTCGCDDGSTVMVASNDDDEMRRFKQILGLIPDEGPEVYSNTPNEKISDIDSVTVDAGGGANAPKDVADIRGEHGRLYGGN